MLTRRNLFKFAATFGLGAFAPRFNQSTHRVAMESRQGGNPPSDRFVSWCERSPLEREWLENLKDDLDCVEVVAHVASAASMPGSVEVNLIRGSSHCPFCGEAGFRVGPESFRCMWCEAEGSAIECYARAEGLPHEVAAVSLFSLLKEGALKGRRLENAHAHRMLEEAARFYHDLLCERPEGKVARECLTEQGIAPHTIERFQVGYAPLDPDDILSRHLVAAGYGVPKLLQSVRVNEEGEQQPVDRYGGGYLLIPICDQAGRSWGFMKRRLISGQDSLHGGWMQDTLAVSERRLRRLIFPAPVCAQDFNRHKRLLVAESPWEVVALHNAGIQNAVYLFDSATDPLRLRTLLASSYDFVCAFDCRGERPATAFRFVEQLERESRQLFVMTVSSKGGLLSLLQSDGHQAVQDAMSQAIPFHQLTGE